MPVVIDHTNKKIGRVLVMELISRGGGGSRWRCKCDCGNDFICWASRFKNGAKFECNKCYHERQKGPDITGKEYGRWTVLRMARDSRNKVVWHCKCECGNEGYLARNTLTHPKKSKSCGCWGRKMKSKWSNPSLYPKASGISTTPFYRLRIQIIHKCYRPEWPTYNLFGAKGITVCDLWRNSAKDMYDWAISNGWKEKTCIVLKEGSKEFSPDNVYLIHNDEFRGVIAKATGQKITYKGETLTIPDWSKKFDIDQTSLRKKLITYPSIEEAFESEHRKMVFANNDALKKEAVDMFLKVRSYTKVGQHFGVKPQTIQYHIRNAVGSQKWNRLEHISDEQIVKHLNEGMSKNAIAKLYNTSYTTIHYRIQRMNGIPKKRAVVIK